MSHFVTIATGKQVVLRDRHPDDVDRWIHWQAHGIWREWDAPWESLRLSTDSERLERIRQSFLEVCREEPPQLREESVISLPNGMPLGTVRRYYQTRDFADAWWLGITIGENDQIGKGYGTEALALWIDYLFTHSPVHRLGLVTYSFNKRMVRVAEKVGFTREGTDREVVNWRDQWVDRVHFGMLRSEWQPQQASEV